MSESNFGETRVVRIQIVEAGARTYPLETAAGLTGIHPDLVRRYLELDLIPLNATGDGEPLFDDDALYELRRIERLRREHHIGWSALPLFLDLLREVDQLRAELNFWRERGRP